MQPLRLPLKHFLLVGFTVLIGLSACLEQPSIPAEKPPVPEPSEPVAADPGPVMNKAFPSQRLTWTETVRSPAALYESQGLAANGYLYIFGGYYNNQIQASLITFAFDPAAKQWYNLAPMPEKITHAGQALVGNKIYLAGGFVGDHPGPPTDHVWVYDIPTDSWSLGPALPQKIGGGALVNVGGRLHFFGGTVRQGFNYLRDSPQHWVLEVAAGSTSWTEAADLLNPRNHTAGVALDGKVYALGGQHLGDEEQGNQSEVDVYDPASDSWQRVADLPQPLGHISASTFTYRGRIIVVMGITQGREKTPKIVAYDPQTDSWENLTSMPGARSATVAGIIDDEIVLATGTVGGEPLDTTWIGSWNVNETGSN